jgi:long-chain acyl-CoA synthetase
MAGIGYVAGAFEMKLGARTLCVMPLFHTNGLMFSTLPFLLTGGTVVLKKRFSASNFWNQCREARVSTTSVSPTILAMLLEHADGARRPRATSASTTSRSPRPHPGRARAALRGALSGGLLETYGLTETTAINVMNPCAARASTAPSAGPSRPRRRASWTRYATRCRPARRARSRSAAPP